MPGHTDPTLPTFGGGIHGWDGTQWRKLALIWGYSDRYLDRAVVTDVSAGDGSADLYTVPTGEVWVVTAVGGYSLQSNVTEIGLQIYDGSNAHTFAIDSSPAAEQILTVPNPLYLKKNDRIRLYWKGALANDDFRIYANGYKMVIAE